MPPHTASSILPTRLKGEIMPNGGRKRRAFFFFGIGQQLNNNKISKLKKESSVALGKSNT